MNLRLVNSDAVAYTPQPHIGEAYVGIKCSISTMYRGAVPITGYAGACWVRWTGTGGRFPIGQIGKFWGENWSERPEKTEQVGAVLDFAAPGAGAAAPLGFRLATEPHCSGPSGFAEASLGATGARLRSEKVRVARKKGALVVGALSDAGRYSAAAGGCNVALGIELGDSFLVGEFFCVVIGCVKIAS